MNTGAVPFKVLCGLTAAVVMAHLLVLQRSARTVQTLAQSSAQAFTTRSIAPSPAPVMAPIPASTPVRKNQTAAAAPQATKLATPARPRTNRPVQSGTFTDITTIGPTETLASAPAPAIEMPSPAIPESDAAGAAPPDGSAAAAGNAVVPTADKQAPNDAPTTGAAPSAAANAAAPAANLTFALPGSTRLKYNVLATKGGLNFNARSELLWQQDGSNYDLRLEVSAFLLGSRVQTSTGRVTSQGLAPKRFADKVRSEVAAHFERDRQLVTFSANTPQIALLAGMQDQLSVFIQLGAMIAGAPAKYPVGTTLTFDTVGPRSGEKWVLTVGEDEKLNLPGGELAALKLTRSPRGDYDQTLEFWLAPQLGYLPVRIKLTEKNGDYADQVWRATESP